MAPKTIVRFSTLCLENDNAIKSGRFEYELAERYSQMPKFGNCWTRALQELKIRCKKNLKYHNQILLCKMKALFTE